VTTPAADPSPAALEAAAVEIARGAATILLDYYRRALAVDYKDAGQSDPVTAADRDAEAYVGREVKVRFPDHAIIGEEGSPGDPSARYLWIVDPVDGTANFINHLPIFAVSIGVLRDGQPVAGAIFVPGPIELGGGVYHAHLGGGAFLDDRPIHAAAAAEPHPSGLVSLPFFWAGRYEFAGDLAKHSGYQRTLGSAAAELAFAASGVMQYGLFGSLRIWDVAAGLIIVREAGGEVYERAGDGWAPFGAFRAGAPTEVDPTGLKGWSESLLFGGREIVRFVSTRVRLLDKASDA
jgi:myo-inositol-1(or 4)-monophosphatase